MENHKYTEQELKAFIPRLENGELDMERFYSDNPWDTHRVDINPYLTVQDKIDIFERANHQLRTDSRFKDMFENKEPEFMKHYNDNLDAIKGLKDTLAEHPKREDD